MQSPWLMKKRQGPATLILRLAAAVSELLIITEAKPQNVGKK